MMITIGILVMMAAALCITGVTVSRSVNQVQVARRDEFEQAPAMMEDYETMLPNDELALLADYRRLKQIDEDQERALYDGGGW